MAEMLQQQAHLQQQQSAPVMAQQQGAVLLAQKMWLPPWQLGYQLCLTLPQVPCGQACVPTRKPPGCYACTL